MHEPWVEPLPLDVFPSLDERYGEIARRVERHPFGRGSRLRGYLADGGPMAED